MSHGAREVKKCEPRLREQGRPALSFSCAEQVQQLGGGSPLLNLEEVKS